MSVRHSAQVFNERAVEYDSWFDHNPVFASELAALQALRTPLPKPRLELGCGPGRFAAPLGVRFGVDPALAPLHLARSRGVLTCQGAGEALPVRPGCLGTIFLLFSLCFVENPGAVLTECRMALRPGGMLVLGTVPLDSPWGQGLDAKRQAGHPFYQYARFVNLATTMTWLTQAGFTLRESRSALLQPPAKASEPGPSVAGIQAGAGFVVLVGRCGRV
ncbi:MAG: methyltransferase type 11 [Deltaproteobacteria bacterium CG23_combo_of_CG06-09_8_20_14_all_60_8]|nr:MAG: methyltransferase type 11 [Deltaproteobacteria bacterium CG23_combo_of_CG06-09_8_20_14_all_60_8]